MTRDEAVKAFDGIAQPASLGTTAWIDRFVALGMLKLDKPKNRMTVFCEQMQWAEGGPMYQELFRALEKAGLTISER